MSTADRAPPVNFPAWAATRLIKGVLRSWNQGPAFTRAQREVLASRGITVTYRGRGVPQLTGPDGPVSVRDARTILAQAAEPPETGTQREVPLPGPWEPPVSDSEWEDFYRDSGITPEQVPVSPSWGWYGVGGLPPTQGFVGPLPDTMPPPVVTPSVVGSVLGRALPWLYVFWPAPTSRTDTRPQPRLPPGGVNRGRPGPFAWPLPDYYNYARPRPRGTPGFVAPLPGLPRIQIDTWPRPAVIDQPLPVEMPKPRVLDEPIAIPSPNLDPRALPLPRALPRAAPIPSPSLRPWSNPLPFLPLAPLLSPYFTGAPSQSPLRGPEIGTLRFAGPLTGIDPTPLQSPAPRPNPDERCTEQQTRRTRTKACSNPVVKRRSYTKGSKRYLTITRELKCPVSSRKKPR